MLRSKYVLKYSSICVENGKEFEKRIIDCNSYYAIAVNLHAIDMATLRCFKLWLIKNKNTKIQKK